jgi:hypothetical protein
LWAAVFLLLLRALSLPEVGKTGIMTGAKVQDHVCFCGFLCEVIAKMREDAA